MFVLFVVACGTSSLPVGTVDGSESPAENDTGTEQIGDSSVDSGRDGDSGLDSAGDTSADTGEDQAETYPKSCPDLYSPDIVPTFDLNFTDEDWTQMAQDCAQGSQAYRPVEFTYDGETVSAQVRMKGNWSWNCEKYQFVISFNEDDPDARFRGLRKIMLDAAWYDRTLLHERMAFPVFERLGLPYSCTNNAKVNVNGQYYGVYSNLERLDHEYLERHFDEPEGNLYQGGTELKTNEDVNDTTNLITLQNADSIDEIDTVMDLDQAVAEWAAEAMIPAMDNIWAGVEINYYLYDHPERGFVYLPYDLDISFGDSAYSDGTLIWPNTVSVDPILYEHSGWQKEPLVERVLADTYWCERFVEALVRARAAFDPSEMSIQAGEWGEQIAEAVAADPRKSYSTADHQAAIVDMQAFFYARADFVDGWLAEGNHCPAVW